MHYFQFEIKEWVANTAHLTLEEEAIYFRLILFYYDSEQLIPLNVAPVFRKLRVTNQELGVALLQEFFTETEQGWKHDRCDAEINKYQAKVEQASKAGKASAERKLNARSTTVQPIINHKSSIINHKSIDTPKASPIAPKVAIPLGIDESLWHDFLKVRKEKKLAVTQTALKGIVREAQKANKSLTEVLTICCERGWGGFKAEWLQQEAIKTQDKPTTAWHQSMAGVMAKGKELGLEPKVGETEGQYRQRIMEKL